MAEIHVGDEAGVQVPYNTEYRDLEAFTVTGFSACVESGGALYEAVRRDGRWEILRDLVGAEKTIYAVASFDKDCSKGKFRYTLGIAGTPAASAESGSGEGLFTIAIPKAGWLVFQLDDFEAQYGAFWEADPYRMVQALGWAFDARVGLHIDAFPESFTRENDAMSFMMPVRKP